MSLRDDILKTYKKAVYEASDERFVRDYYPCDIPAIDKALHGGLIRGALMEIYGPWSVGKSLLMAQFLIANQKRGGTSVLYLSEGKAAFDPSWYEAQGGILDGPNGLLIIPVKTIEDVFTKTYEILENVEKSVNKGGESPSLIFGWDSIAATGSKKLFDTGMDKTDFTKAKAISEGCKLITTLLSNTDSSFIGVNQERSNIGDPEWAEKNTAGGKAFKYHASQRIELGFDGGPGSSRVKDAETNNIIGRRIRGKVLKARAPERSFRFTVYVDTGYPHPVFEGLEVKAGIDIPECVFTFYKDNTFGPDKKPLLVSAGPRWKIDAPGYGVSFFRKEWPTILEKHPELLDVNFDPYSEEPHSLLE